MRSALFFLALVYSSLSLAQSTNVEKVFESLANGKIETTAPPVEVPKNFYSEQLEPKRAALVKLKQQTQEAKALGGVNFTSQIEESIAQKEQVVEDLAVKSCLSGVIDECMGLVGSNSYYGRHHRLTAQLVAYCKAGAMHFCEPIGRALYFSALAIEETCAESANGCSDAYKAESAAEIKLSRELFLHGCSKGDMASCYQLAQDSREKKSKQFGFTALESRCASQKCSAGEAGCRWTDAPQIACGDLASMHERAGHFKAAFQFAKKACALGNDSSCLASVSLSYLSSGSREAVRGELKSICNRGKRATASASSDKLGRACSVLSGNEKLNEAWWQRVRKLDSDVTSNGVVLTIGDRFDRKFVD